MRSLIKRLSQHIDQTVLLVILLSLIASWPFLLRPSLPRETDAELHVFRAAELGYAIRGGALYPRWASDFYYGYGYPIFNYYAPLTYYLANVISLLIPGGVVFGVKGVFVLGFLCCGLGTFALVRRLVETRAGLAAAASYLFAPYIHYVDPHARGDLAEFFALGIAPLALWALTALHQTSQRRYFVASVLLIAGLILTHNLLALVYFALILAYAVWHGLAILQQKPDIAPPSHARRGVLFSFPALVLGLLLASFFWLPVVLERNAVQLGNLIGPGHFDYRNHFLTLGELLSPSLPLDLGAVNPAFRFNLGVAQWALAALGILVYSAQRVSARRAARSSGSTQWTTSLLSSGFWLLAGIGLLLLMLPLSTPLWDGIPLMAFMQFPWRLLGPMALCLAVIGGLSTQLLNLIPLKRQSYALAAWVLLPVTLALPLFIPPNWGDFGATDQLAMLEFELHGLALGTTSTGDFVPVAVDTVPGPQPDLIASYRDGGPVDKVNRHTLPEGATVQILRHGPTEDVFLTESPEGFVLRLYTFMFAGWRATVDGQATEIEIAKPEGFITVPISAGSHSVRVWLGSTPARTLASAISAVALVATGLMAWQWRESAYDPSSLPCDQSLVPSLVGLGIVLVTAFAGGFTHVFQPHSTGLIAEPASYPLHAHIQGGIDLIGFDAPVTAVHPGETVILTVYWKAREEVSDNFQVFAHLTSEPQHLWGQSDKLNPGDYPTTRWPLYRYVRDPHAITVPLGTPPGTYILRTGLWDRDTGRRQLVVDSGGNILGDAVTLPVMISVLPADTPPDVGALPLDVTLNAVQADNLTLLGGGVLSGSEFAMPAGWWTLALYWRCDQSPLLNYLVALRLVNPSGEIALRQDTPPVEGRYPMSGWSSGEIVRDLHSLWIDENLPEGHYTVEIGVCRAAGCAPTRWVKLTELSRRLP